MDEFALIHQHFAGLTPAASDVVLGIGDDAALVAPPPGFELAITTDTLVAGRHFPSKTTAADIGWKSLAVNLSDLAAMGAQPRWFTLALTLPESDERWLASFAAGLGELARQAGIALVGGDTTRGPLAVSITAMGVVPAARALLRSRAQPGDVVCVTGTLGDAALALGLLLDQQTDDHEAEIKPLTEDPVIGIPASDDRRVAAIVPPMSADVDMAFLQGRLNRPEARVTAGLVLRDLAHAAVDLSDGLAGDLSHILQASGMGAEIDIDRLPMSPSFVRIHRRTERLHLQASGGDDYELCACLSPERLEAAQRALGDLPLTPIGRIVREPGLRWLDEGGKTIRGPTHGYRHF